MGALEVSGDIGMEEADTVRTPSPTDKTSLLLDTVVLFSLLCPLSQGQGTRAGFMGWGQGMSLW